MTYTPKPASTLQTKLRQWLGLLEAHPTLALGLIGALALSINVVMLIARPPTLELGQPQLGQTYRWWNLILNVLKGRGYLLCITSYFPFCGPGNEVTASLEPVPVFFFGTVALLTNQSLLAACIAEVGINLVMLFTIFLLARSLAGNLAALGAAFIWATYIPVLKLISQISGDLLGGCFLSLGLFFFMRARQTCRWRDWIIAGMAISLAIQCRSALLAVVPGLLAGLLLEGWFKNPRKWSKLVEQTKPGALIALIVFVSMLPWFVRNIITFKSPVLGTSLTGYVIFRQNYMLGTDDYLRYVGSQEAHRVVEDLVARRSDLSKTLNEIEMDRVYRSEAIKIISAYPGRYILLSFYRLIPLWFNWKINESYGGQTDPIEYAVMLEQGFLLVTALVGAWKTRGQTWPLTVCIIFVNLAYMAVNCQIRYLVPVMPFVISLAMVGLQRLITRPAKGFPAWAES
jgi:hypothetical protein